MNKWTVEKIRDLLENNPKAVLRAIVAIYNRQTEDEKYNQITVEHNKVGFNAFDAKIGSYIAKKVIAGQTINAGLFNKAKILSLRYAKQLAAIANGLK